MLALALSLIHWSMPERLALIRNNKYIALCMCNYYVHILNASDRHFLITDQHVHPRYDISEQFGPLFNCIYLARLTFLNWQGVDLAWYYLDVYTVLNNWRFRPRCKRCENNYSFCQLRIFTHDLYSLELYNKEREIWSTF